MEVVGLALVLLLAQATGTLAASREYHLVNEPKTWAQARTYCRENFADLATIETEEDQAKVADMISNAGSQYAWIGLYDDVKSWRWSLDNTSFYENAYSFHAFTFNNLDGIQYCGMLDAAGVGDLPCAREKPALCYDQSSNTYITVTSPMNWQSARSYCMEHHTDLAILRNQQELNIARTQTVSGAWWIGLSRESWKWSDQTNFLFTKWEAGQPDKPDDCGAASVDGWNDLDCSTSHPFICSVPIRKVLKVEIKTDGRVDLNDPLVQEAILRQVEKDMKARGIKQDVKLTWRNKPAGNVFN